MPDKMQKEIIEMPDGRLLYSYTFVENNLPDATLDSSEPAIEKAGE